LEGQARLESDHSDWQFRRGIGVREAATDRSSAPRRWMTHMLECPGQERRVAAGQRRSKELGLSGHRADTQMIFAEFDAGNARDRIEIDEFGRPCKAESHHRDKALASGEKASSLAMFLQ
jgi:hypothetical protein